ncbi:hypothetical protein H4S07_002986 [Coemansia furcata]|uniref:Uncharacterized protein n=1 Tax=Coemansia furcata TaxID=417177 RepID=A0ACC1LJE8_9FUNG|nr:hypothetical protein H4S07_002986 [Coemansia furcata]
MAVVAHYALGLHQRLAQLGWTEYTGLALTILAVVFIYRLIRELYFSPLRHIPGPLFARLTKRYYEVVVAMGQMAPDARRNTQKYGNIYVCQPNGVSISNPADIRAVLSSTAFLKHDYYKILRFTGIDSIMSTRDPHMVSMKRRMLGPYFSSTYVSRMEPLILEHGINAIKRKWDGLLADGGRAEVNFCSTFTLCTFNIVSRLVYGQEIEVFKTTSSVDTLEWMSSSTNYISVRALLQLLPRPLFYIITLPWEHKYKQIASYVYGSIAERKQLLSKLKSVDEKSRPVDLLQALVDCEEPESKVRLTGEQIHAESLLLLIGGIDPTAYSLTWTMHLFMLYPDCYREATREVRGVFGAHHTVTYAEAKAQLPYLEACILESMRLVTVPGVQIPRTTPPGGTTIQGQYLPEGTIVFANLWGSHHSAEYWREPGRFDPTRFLNNKRAQHSVFTFGYGNRICMGKQLALIKMFTILANLLKDYDMSLPEDYTRRGPHVLDAVSVDEAPVSGY